MKSISINDIQRRLQDSGDGKGDDKNSNDFDAFVSGMTLMLVAAGIVALIMIGILIWFCVHHKKVRLSPNNELVNLTNRNTNYENKILAY